MSQIDSDYWTGPFCVKISKDIDHVVARDGYNTLYKSGGMTLTYISKPISREEYLEKYCVYDPISNQYFWKG